MSECIPRFPVTPDQVDAQWALVEGGAVMARQRRNALVLVDGVEHSRRCESGLGAVTDGAIALSPWLRGSSATTRKLRERLAICRSKIRCRSPASPRGSMRFCAALLTVSSAMKTAAWSGI